MLGVLEGEVEMFELASKSSQKCVVFEMARENVPSGRSYKTERTSSNLDTGTRTASFDYFRNRLIDANNRLLSINRMSK